jgi:aryl-alcohol dehydrogenase-like predicted oxidoreductase
VTAAVVGARTPEEIAADVSYLSIEIPDELWEAASASWPAGPGALPEPDQPDAFPGTG